MRLAFLSTFGQPCGVAAHTAQVMDGLHAAARLRGVNLEMLVLAEEVKGQPCADPPNVHRCWNRKWFDVAGTLEVLARERVDILHLMFHGDLFRNTDLAGLLQACRKRGIRLFGTFHFMDGQAELAAETINLLDRAFVHVEEGARRFVAHGAEPDRLRLASLGDSLDRFATSSAAAKLALGLPNDLELVTSLGSFEPHEGVLEIIEALPEVVARHPAVQFAFMGDAAAESPDRAVYIQRCRDAAIRLGVENHVTFQAGSVPADEAGSYLAASDVVVLNHTARRNDLSPAAAFVLVHGRPLVTTDAPAFAPLRGCTLQTSPDMNLAQAINRVLEDPRLASRLEAQARAFLEESLFVRLGELLLGEYGLLAGNTPVGRPAPGELQPAVHTRFEGHARVG